MADERPDETPTLRDSFAAAALTGLTTGTMVQNVEEAIAQQAYRLADAVIQVRKTTSAPPPVEPPVEPPEEEGRRRR